MATKERMNSIKKTARVTGILYLSLLPLAIFSNFIVPSNLFVPADATATASNIMASESLFRLSLVSWLVVFLIDIGLSVLLYVLLKPVSKTLSLVAASFRLAYSAIQGLNLLNLFFPLLLLSGADYLTVFETDQLHALVLLFLNAHSSAFNIAIVFFAPHVFFVGYLVFKSGYIPRVLGVLFIFASLSYLIDSSARLLLTNYPEVTPVYLVLPIVIGELAFPLWLVIKGVNVEQWEKRALESA